MNATTRAIWMVDRHVVSRSFSLPHRAGRAFIEVLALLDLPPRGVKISRGTAGGIDCWQVAPAARSGLSVGRDGTESARLLPTLTLSRLCPSPIFIFTPMSAMG
jgi:hypothetical protein